MESDCRFGNDERRANRDASVNSLHPFSASEIRFGQCLAIPSQIPLSVTVAHQLRSRASKFFPADFAMAMRVSSLVLSQLRMRSSRKFGLLETTARIA
jgi:hypothetical protein